MSWIDILILVLGICLALSLIAYFLYRKLAGKGSECAECETTKKGQSLVKAYHKKYKKEGCSCQNENCAPKETGEAKENVSERD